MKLSLVLATMFTSMVVHAELALTEKLEIGLQSLYNGQLSPTDLHAKVDRALATKAKYKSIVDAFDVESVKWKNVDVNQMELEFPSPIQKDNSKGNTVFGYIYFPNVPMGCDFKFPATLLVHHVDDKITPQQMVGLQAARMAKGIVMVIVLPEYGKRKNSKDPNASPFNGNLDDFKEDLFQSLVDIRASYEVLKRVQNVDMSRVQVAGLSLGGALAATMAGFDPVFDRYLIGVGGGDYGSMMTSYNHGREAGGAIKWALQNVKAWKADAVRDATDDLDAFTWAANIGAKKVQFISAKEDEIFPLETNVNKLAAIYRQSGSEVRIDVHPGMHVPDHKAVGVKTALKIYWSVAKNIFGFVGDSQAAVMDMCAAQYR